MDGKVLIISDPMLATGSSMVLTCKELLSRGDIKSLHIVSVIGSSVGVEYVQRHLPKAKIWIGAVDEELTTKAYIVPGLGDAGDLAFGEKI
jgi:uracil phosphoribosyltransferase